MVRISHRSKSFDQIFPAGRSMVAGSGRLLLPLHRLPHFPVRERARSSPRASSPRRRAEGCSRRGTPTRAAPRRRIERRAYLGDGRQGVRGVPVRHAHGALSRSVSSPRPRRAVGRPSIGSHARSARGDGDLLPRAPAAPSLSREGCPLFKRADPSRVDACSPPSLPLPAPHPLCRSSARRERSDIAEAASLSSISLPRDVPPSWTRSARTSWTAACSQAPARGRVVRVSETPGDLTRRRARRDFMIGDGAGVGKGAVRSAASSWITTRAGGGSTCGFPARATCAAARRAICATSGATSKSSTGARNSTARRGPPGSRPRAPRASCS